MGTAICENHLALELGAYGSIWSKASIPLLAHLLAFAWLHSVTR